MVHWNKEGRFKSMRETPREELRKCTGVKKRTGGMVSSMDGNKSVISSSNTK